MYIRGDEKSYVTRTRLQGIKEVARQKQVGLIIKNANFLENEAREIAMQYGKEVDAIVCASDLMAIGAKRAMKEMEIECPICGFDGISLMEYVGQGIYTIGQNFAQISAIAVEELQNLMNGDAGRIVEVEYTLFKN